MAKINIREYIGPPLFDRSEITTRVSEIAKEVEKRFNPEAVFVVPIMTGSMMFCADLVRSIKLPTILAPVYIALREDDEPELLSQIPLETFPKRILLVDDLINTGATMMSAIDILMDSTPVEEIVTAVLFTKGNYPLDRIRLDIVGFRAPNQRLIGYGMDYRGYFRDQSHVSQILKEWDSAPGEIRTD